MTITKTITKKMGLLKAVGSLLAAGVLNATLFAQTTTAQATTAQSAAAARYDEQIQVAVAQKLTSKSQFRDVKRCVGLNGQQGQGGVEVHAAIVT